MVLTGSITGSPLFLPLLAVAGLIIAVILWKILKFTVKKTTSILQGLIAILLIFLALIGQPQGFVLYTGLIGLGLLFGAISNFFS